MRTFERVCSSLTTAGLWGHPGSILQALFSGKEAFFPLLAVGRMVPLAALTNTSNFFSAERKALRVVPQHHHFLLALCKVAESSDTPSCKVGMSWASASGICFKVQAHVMCHTVSPHLHAMLAASMLQAFSGHDSCL